VEQWLLKQRRLSPAWTEKKLLAPVLMVWLFLFLCFGLFLI